MTGFAGSSPDNSGSADWSAMENICVLDIWSDIWKIFIHVFPITSYVQGMVDLTVTS